ncbi:unnamed protein product, partial [Linum tenue]
AAASEAAATEAGFRRRRRRGFHGGETCVDGGDFADESAGFRLRDKTNVKRHRRNPPPSPPPQPEEDEEEEDDEVAAQVRAQGVKTFR